MQGSKCVNKRSIIFLEMVIFCLVCSSAREWEVHIDIGAGTESSMHAVEIVITKRLI